MGQSWFDGCRRVFSGDMTAFGGHPLSEATSARLRADAIASIARYTPAMMIANAFNAAVLYFVLMSTPMSEKALFWAFGVIGFSTFVYLRHTRRGAQKSNSASVHAIWRACLNAFLMGCLWASVPLWFFSGETSTAQLIVVCLCIGILCGGAFALSNLPIAAMLFATPVYLGSSLAVIRSGDGMLLLVAVLLGVYMYAILRAIVVHALQHADRFAAQVEAERVAQTDWLTKLPNRAAFLHAMEVAVARQKRYGEGFAVFYMDLDDFKGINDKLGHSAGDDLLIQVADRLRSCVRDLDTVGRLGGDEFAIVEANVSSPLEAAILAKRILKAFGRPFELKGADVRNRVSIGIAMSSLDGLEPALLLHNADTALYRAKNEGRGIYRFFQPSHDSQTQERNAFEEDLRQAIALDRLQMSFAPVMDVRAKNVASQVGTLHWQHETRGSLPAQVFVPRAEDIGMSFAIAQVMIDKACLMLVTHPDDVAVRLALPAKAFTDAHLYHYAVGQLEKALVSANRLILDVGAPVLALGDFSMQNLLGFKDAGVRLALTGFGTLPLPMDALRDVCFSHAVLDEELVVDILEDSNSASIVRRMIELGHDLNLRVVADHVRSESLLVWLKLMGCDEISGNVASTSRLLQDLELAPAAAHARVGIAA